MRPLLGSLPKFVMLNLFKRGWKSEPGWIPWGHGTPPPGFLTTLVWRVACWGQTQEGGCTGQEQSYLELVFLGGALGPRRLSSPDL